MSATTPTWATGSAAYAAYLAASERCAQAFAPQIPTTPWTNPTTGETRRYLDDVAAIVFPAAREAYNGHLSNSQCSTIRLMISQARPYLTSAGAVRGGSIMTGLARFDADDFRAAVKTAATR